MERQLALETFDVPPFALNMPKELEVPGGGWTWPCSTATLISGETEAVLIDTVPTLRESNRLIDWIKASGKTLKTIYITHGHFDHYIGASIVLEHFPDASLVATKSTIDFIEEERETGRDRAIWSPLFTEEIAQNVIIPELTSGSLDIEGHEITAVEVGQSDIPRSSYVHIPSLGAVIVGDIAYNQVHPTLIDSDQETRSAWIQTLSDLLDLKPKIVVASHRTPDSINDIRAIEETIAYLRTANQLLEENPSTSKFIERMMAAYPSFQNLSTLYVGAASLGLEDFSEVG
ncbi:MBL fold metallo-hydrolase [uncultured Roseibium sp.]|uniref:MBL fold metallo-hydrolase n=1 Tax=uncultured Roseibium sp. TaxID=1936171 RepID=UPI00260C8F1E|nr:MBL fold metallo-hydrolase [uncultured Roseibium sp.]